MKRTDFSQMKCSVARATEIMTERWVILLMREAFYGVTRFDEFQLHLGIAPNILAARLRKLVEYGIFERVPTAAHAARFDYRLTEQGKDFFPVYMAIKDWGDRWLADPAGPLVVFKEKATGQLVHAPPLLSSEGEPISPQDVFVAPAAGAGPVTWARFGHNAEPGARPVPKRPEPGKAGAGRRKKALPVP